VAKDLEDKMVFLGGPRQVGKTTVTEHLLNTVFPGGILLNWDSRKARERILAEAWEDSVPLVVFDELHKYPRWKQWIKGVYDTKPSHQTYAVTGSAKLNVYKKGGDSLLGRYHYWRIHPLTLDELPSGVSPKEGFQRLMTLGGFPESFLGNDERKARRWRKERYDRILREDIQDVSRVRDVQLIQLLLDALRARAGSMITYSNLAGDLQVSPNTIKEWIGLIAEMYIAFPVYPYSKNLPRAIQKPVKLYFYDNADCTGDEGARLENLVATHLLKRLHFLEDYEGYQCSLHYIRDKDGREVDFVTVVDGKVTDLIEVKLSDDKISTSLKYFKSILNPVRTTQLVANLKHPYDKDGVSVMTPIKFFSKPLWDNSSE
jgi:hypothetical protein